MPRRARAGLRTRLIAVVIAVGVTLPLTGCVPPGIWTPDPDPSASIEAGESVRVLSVADGDTFTARAKSGAKVKVRMLSIDAPEEAHDGAPADCGARAASTRLRELIVGQTVRLLRDPRADASDRYGRWLRYVEVEGHDAALTLISEGLVATWYPHGEPEPTRYRNYVAAEDTARAARTGSWQGCDKLGR